MDVILIFILYCFTGISARPVINRIERDSKIIKGHEMSKRVAREAPTWHMSPDIFHLPKPFSLEDEIGVIVNIRNSERLIISFVMDENATEASTVYKLVADFSSKKITFHHDDKTTLITHDTNVFVKKQGEETEFHARFRRKEDASTQESNILYLNHSYELTDIASMDNIRYIKITGDTDIKVKKMEFIFSN